VKRVYIWDEKQKLLVQVSGDWKPTKRTDAVDRYVEDARLYGNGGVAPGTNVLINTKRRHREYMRQHGLTTADDCKETWAKAEAERERVRAFGTDPAITSGYERKPDKARREAIERAFHDVVDKGKRYQGGADPLPAGLVFRQEREK